MKTSRIVSMVMVLFFSLCTLAMAETATNEDAIDAFQKQKERFDISNSFYGNLETDRVRQTVPEIPDYEKMSVNVRVNGIKLGKPVSVIQRFHHFQHLSTIRGEVRLAVRKIPAHVPSPVLALQKAMIMFVREKGKSP